MKPLLDGLRALGPARQAALAAVAVGMLALLALLAARGGASDQMALLYADLNPREAGQIVEQLGRRHVRYRLAGGGTQILVPPDQIPETRLALAREGLPSGGSVGYELFDRGDGLAFTEFQQKINETRALEGEIARTVRAIKGVRQARVHLVLPRREPFARDRQDAQASVLVSMHGQQRLDREAVQSILNLVSAAVPGLRPQNIAVVDSRGDLLARAGQPLGALAQAQTAEEVRRAAELRLARSVEEMLERSLGPGRVRAEAALRMDFDRVSETQERFDPEGQVVRSQQNVSQNSKSTEANATVSVQNNLPNADAGSQGAGNQEQRQEETVNYEIGKSVRTVAREQPRLERLSVAVMVDGIETVGADGKRDWKPRSDEEIARIAALVKSAVGYDEKRGDTVEVATMRFASEAAPDADAGGWLGARLEKADLVKLAQTALFGVVGLLALLLVLRPMVARLTALAPPLPAAGGAGAGGAELTPAILAAVAQGDFSQLPPGLALPAPLAARAAAALGGPGAALALGGPAAEDDAMVSMAQIEGQLRAASIRKLAELVDKHPDETVSIVRGWMAQDHA